MDAPASETFEPKAHTLYIATRDPRLAKHLLNELQDFKVVLFNNGQMASDTLRQAPPSVFIVDENVVDEQGVSYFVRICKDTMLPAQAVMLVSRGSEVPSWLSEIWLSPQRHRLSVITTPFGAGELREFLRRIINPQQRWKEVEPGAVNAESEIFPIP